MTARITDISLGIILSWIAWGVLSIFTGTIPALIIGAFLAALSARYLRHTIVLRGLVAVLEPMGVVLPLLILRQALIALGLPFSPFGAFELLGFLILYIAFLATAFGVLPLDPYRFGYRPLPVAVIVIVLCLFGLMTGNAFIPLIAVTGQALWSFRIGSSNYFDHILHVSLVPVVVIALIARLIW